jgi:hypothetical protein
MARAWRTAGARPVERLNWTSPSGLYTSPLSVVPYHRANRTCIHKPSDAQPYNQDNRGIWTRPKIGYLVPRKAESVLIPSAVMDSDKTDRVWLNG